jgi:hypothetical protein
VNLLTDFLHEPGVVRQWRAGDWNRFLPLARDARLLGRILYLLEEQGLVEASPARIVDQLKGALAQTRYIQGQAMRELRHVVRELHRAGIPVMVLKGIAYLYADLPPARWRGLSDIDLMVARADIERADAALRAAGWAWNGEFDAYDEQYYRDWMHEVPPLRHHRRETEVDLHHNLSPPVSRIRIDADRLWRHAVALPALEGARVVRLGPADLLLHNAVHLFMNDELRGGLRDVVDFADLYRHFALANPSFGTELLERAAQLGCGLPLYYAVATSRRLVGLRLPAEVEASVDNQAPVWPIRHLMLGLIEAALAPRRLGLARTAVANWLLFVRSHWVRMPLSMLFRHLARKALKRKRPISTIQETPG